MISIRQAKVQDADIIAKIGAKTFVESNYTKNKKELALYLKTAFSKSKILKAIRSKSSFFLIAFWGNSPIGYAKLNRNYKTIKLSGKKCIELERIYILKKWTGKKIGTVMLKTCLRIACLPPACRRGRAGTAKKEKNKFMVAQVWGRNLKAIKIYKKWGFKAFDKAFFHLGGIIQKDVLMKKKLC